MKFNLKIIILVVVIIIVSAFLRFYQLENIPPGINIDESSEGYNAFSILRTGKDRYGQSFPILFRSFGSFQAPLYTYLTIIPVYFYGNSVFSVRLISVLSGIILSVITFFLFLNFKDKKRVSLAMIAALTVAMSPWAIFFGRIGTEASLGASLFVLGLVLLYLSLKRPKFFIFACMFLGLSTHAYYSERIIAPFFVSGFVFFFRKTLLQSKKIFVLGICLFLLIQIPHLLIANSGALTRRMAQVNYFSEDYFQSNGGELQYIPLGRLLYIAREFLSQYFAYFSPKNLFFDPDPQSERSIPDLSVFYNWMLLPLLFGVIRILKNKSNPLIKIIILTVIIAPIPAALTRDPFYTIRTLVLLWALTIIIALGIDDILNKLSKPIFKYSLIIFLLLYSGISLYSAYFILLKYEREIFDYSYVKLLEKTNNLPEEKFIVDSSRQLANGIRFAFFKKYNPAILQKDLEVQISGRYYSNFEFDEPYVLGNIEARSIDWKKDTCKRQVLVGDLLAISSGQADEHHLKWFFDIKNMAGDVALRAYFTSPDKSCMKFTNNYLPDQ